LGPRGSVSSTWQSFAGPGGFVCAGCGGRQAWRLKARLRVYECTACHRQESVTAGTVLHRTRTVLSKWFVAAYLMGRDKRGVSAKFLQRELAVIPHARRTRLQQKCECLIYTFSMYFSHALIGLGSALLSALLRSEADKQPLASPFGSRHPLSLGKPCR